MWIHAIETAVPEFTYAQGETQAKMLLWQTGAAARRLIKAIYPSCGIEQRHSVIGSFDNGAPDDFFRKDDEGRLLEPGTAYRNELFARKSRPLAVALSGRILAHAPDLGPDQVTHLITASCTGFCNPGPDLHIVQDLGLRESVERYHLGFMGCYAAIPALRLATQFCQANPNAVVLVVCLEFCSIHLRLDGRPDSVLANALFSDGAGAFLISGRPPRSGDAVYAVETFASALILEGETDMAWTLGDHGFIIGLSSYVPQIIANNLRGRLEHALESMGLRLEDIATWALHPGGRSIVDKAEKCLGLRSTQLAASRAVLRQHGNMSSATIVFVLKEILEQPGDSGDRICAVAFGPGLTVELAVLQRVQSGSRP